MRTAMIAITTRSSINVNARRFICGLLHRELNDSGSSPRSGSATTRIGSIDSIRERAERRPPNQGNSWTRTGNRRKSPTAQGIARIELSDFVVRWRKTIRARHISNLIASDAAGSGLRLLPSSFAFGGSEIVKVRLGVGLGPEADHAGFLERAVLGFEEFLAVQVAGDFRPDHGDAKGVPLFIAYCFGVLEHRSNAVDDLVNAKVVFERVIPADVVILLILGAPDHAAATVDFAGHRPELDAQVDVFVACSFDQGDVERGVRILGLLMENLVCAFLGDEPFANFIDEALGASCRARQTRNPRCA